MKKMNVLVTVVSSLVFSMAAFASDGGTSAAGSPGSGTGGTTGCNYSYMIQKIGQDFADKGESVTYHVIVKNTGDCRLQHIDVRDHMPRGMTFVSATPTPTTNVNDRLEWTDVTLTAGHYMDFVINATVDTTFDRNDSRVLTNTACAFDPRIGIRICDSSTMTVLWDHHNQ